MSSEAIALRVHRFLWEQRLVSDDQQVALTPLTGGVSSELWKVELPTGPVCVKAALPQLKVAQPWFAPVERNDIEYEWLRFAHDVRPKQVPRVLAHDERAGMFAMEYLPPDRYPVWKALLFAGQVSEATASDVGELVGRLHAASAADQRSAALFATDASFDALRIDPYLRVPIKRNPDLAEQLGALAARTAAIHLAVVHGDVSPKNILIGPDGPVLLDAECAWFGDPAFDVAFCLNHLLIKSITLPEYSLALRHAARALIEAHAAQVSWESRPDLDVRVATLQPALALGRVDGRSPLEYLEPGGQETVRRISRTLMLDPAGSSDELLDRWSELTRIYDWTLS